MGVHKLVIAILLGVAATASAADQPKRHPLESRRKGNGELKESWQVKYNSEHTGKFLALQMAVNVPSEADLTQPTVPITMNLTKYTAVNGTNYQEGTWGPTGSTLALSGYVENKKEASGKFKRVPMRYRAVGVYWDDDGVPCAVTVWGRVTPTHKNQGANPHDLRVTFSSHEVALLTVPWLPRNAAKEASGKGGEPCQGSPDALSPRSTTEAEFKSGTDPCEGVSAEDILEEGDYVDPTMSEFSYDSEYLLP